MVKQKHLILVATLFVGILLGGVSVYVVMHQRLTSVLDMVQPIREEGTYNFINPLLACDLPESAQLDEYATLGKDIKGLIAKQELAGQVNQVSVYMKELNRGRWVGINADAQYDPASLMKVVLMIAYFKELRSNPTVLTEKLTYTKALADIVDKLPFEATSTILVGDKFAAEDLIKK